MDEKYGLSGIKIKSIPSVALQRWWCFPFIIQKINSYPFSHHLHCCTGYTFQGDMDSYSLDQAQVASVCQISRRIPIPVQVLGQINGYDEASARFQSRRTYSYLDTTTDDIARRNCVNIPASSNALGTSLIDCSPPARNRPSSEPNGLFSANLCT